MGILLYPDLFQIWISGPFRFRLEEITWAPWSRIWHFVMCPEPRYHLTCVRESSEQHYEPFKCFELSTSTSSISTTRQSGLRDYKVIQNLVHLSTRPGRPIYTNSTHWISKWQKKPKKLLKYISAALTQQSMESEFLCSFRLNEMDFSFQQSILQCHYLFFYIQMKLWHFQNKWLRPKKK